MLRLLFHPLWLLLFLSPSLQGVDLEDYLKQYEGRWLGDYTIHSTATGVTDSFPVELRYWMEGDRLLGVAVFELSDGVKTARSTTYVDGTHLVSEVKRGDDESVYLGIPKDGAIVWIPANLNRAEDYQMTERFVEVEGSRKLLTEGFDTYLYGDGIAHLVYRGESVRVGPFDSWGD